MKTIAIFILFQFMVLIGYCQTGSNEYTSATYNYSSTIYTFMKNKFGDTISLRRLETGVLYPVKGQLFASTTRKLFKGNHYMVFAYTDDRVKDFSLKCYKNDAVFKEIPSGSKEGSFAHIGNYELFSFDATDDAVYEFDIIAPNQERAARYGLMLFSSTTPQTNQTQPNNNGNNNGGDLVSGGVITPPSAPYVSYNIDYYQFATLDRTKNAYGAWSAQKTYACNFTLNYDQTLFTETAAGKNYYYKVVTKRTSDNQKWFMYDVTNSSGQSLTFFVPTSTNTDGVFRMSRDYTSNGTTTNYLFDYHIVR